MYASMLSFCGGFDEEYWNFWNRAWKGMDWDVLDRLYERGWIDNPRNKAKSIVFTEEGLALSERLFEQYFGSSNEGDDEL